MELRGTDTRRRGKRRVVAQAKETHLEEKFVLPRNLVGLAPQTLHARVVYALPAAEVRPGRGGKSERVIICGWAR